MPTFGNFILFNPAAEINYNDISMIYLPSNVMPHTVSDSGYI